MKRWFLIVAMLLPVGAAGDENAAPAVENSINHGGFVPFSPPPTEAELKKIYENFTSKDFAEVASDASPAWLLDQMVQCYPQELGEENQVNYVRHLYGLLDEVDNGKSGEGYYLAVELGYFLGVKPHADMEKPFQPSPELVRHEQPDGRRTTLFCQTTVDNAKAWWEEHGDAYVAARKGKKKPSSP